MVFQVLEEILEVEILQIEIAHERTTHERRRHHRERLEIDIAEELFHVDVFAVAEDHRPSGGHAGLDQLAEIQIAEVTDALRQGVALELDPFAVWTHGPRMSGDERVAVFEHLDQSVEITERTGVVGGVGTHRERDQCGHGQERTEGVHVRLLSRLEGGERGWGAAPWDDRCRSAGSSSYGGMRRGWGEPANFWEKFWPGRATRRVCLRFSLFACKEAPNGNH